MNELGEMFDKMITEIADYTFLTLDGAEYDSTQWDWLHEAVDVRLMKRFIRIYGERTNIDLHIIEQLERYLTKTKFTFKVCFLDTKSVMMDGIANGTTLSGIAT